MNELEDILAGIRAQMSRDGGRFTISDMLQNIIYFFNTDDVRDHIINHYIKLLLSTTGKKIVWDGTFYFNEKGFVDPYYHPKHPNTHLRDFIAGRVEFKNKSTRYVLFTCCILYEQNRVHYLSFIYDMKKKLLISFDPGVHLYTKGQDVLVPLIRQAFIDNALIGKKANDFERVGLCETKHYDRRWGIQYDGSDPKVNDLPADSFCQSWTLFFLIAFMRHKCSDHFFRNWCSIHPEHRENFIILSFFLPHLQQDSVIYKKFKKFYPEGDLTKLTEHVIKSFPRADKTNKK